MNFRYQDLKVAIYILQTLLGFVLLSASVTLFSTTAAAVDPLCYIIPAIVLTVVGVGCVFFGVETYLLRDDPDIWR